YLPSHNEGTPRVLAEALLMGTPCLIASALKTPLRKNLDELNSIALDDEPQVAAAEILDGLRSYGRFRVDVEAARAEFGASRHVGRLRDSLATMLAARDQRDQGDWFLDDLHFRL